MRCTESYSVTDGKLPIRYKLNLSNMPELTKSHLTMSIPSESVRLDYTKAYRWLDSIYEICSINKS